MKNIFNKSLYKRAIKFFIFIIFITIFVTSITYIINPDLKEITETLEKAVSNDVIKSKGIRKVFSYTIHNGFKVPLQMIALSLVPIQFLYFINTLITASLPGVLFGVMLQENVKIGVSIIISTIPYFIFEIFAFSLFASVLFEVNQTVRIKIKNLYKKDKKEVFFIKKIKEVLQIYIILFLPMIIIASFLEAYLADIISSLFK